MDYEIRQAKKEEARSLAQLVNIAGMSADNRGLDYYGWAIDAKDGEDPFDVGRKIIAMETGKYSYRNMRVIESDGRVAALSMSVVVEKKTAQEMEKIPEDFRIFTKLTNLIVGSYYLDSLASSPDFRGMGFGRMMLDDTVSLARKKGFNEIYLIAFEENKGAVKLYERNGFYPISDLPAGDNPKMPYGGRVVLYKKDI